MIRKIIYYGNPLLRKKCLPIEKITDDIIRLGEDLIETMDAGKNAIGLAASQVGVLLRMFVLRPVIEKEDGTSVLGESEVYINPILSSPSLELEPCIEGCISFPNAHGEVIRPYSIHVEALDLKGNKIKREVSGFHAREVMHENDHLNGVLFIDRMNKQDRKRLEPFLRKIKKKYN